jgi:hypothetical protein
MMCQNLSIFRHDIDNDSSTDEELSDNEASSDEVRCTRSVYLSLLALVTRPDPDGSTSSN